MFSAVGLPLAKIARSLDISVPTLKRRLADELAEGNRLLILTMTAPASDFDYEPLNTLTTWENFRQKGLIPDDPEPFDIQELFGKFPQWTGQWPPRTIYRRRR